EILFETLNIANDQLQVSRKLMTAICTERKNCEYSGTMNTLSKRGPEKEKATMKCRVARQKSQCEIDETVLRLSSSCTHEQLRLDTLSDRPGNI
ncbi:unnamed protein product, partial [Heterotrigona itama]